MRGKGDLRSGVSAGSQTHAELNGTATSTTSFVYDGDGNLVKKTNPDSSKTIYVGGVYEVDKSSSGSVTHTRVYYPAGGAMRIDGTLYFVLKDHLGSANVITNASGNILTNGEQRYYPFGEKRSPLGTMLTDRLYTGQRDTGLGIYFYNARYYSPYITQFSQPDSIVPDPYNPQDLNRYAYARYNPLRYTDPSGHRVCEEKAGVCKAYTQADQISDLKLIIKDQFKWFVKGKDWTVKELETIYQTGTDIMTYIDKETGGYGLDWMNKYLGGVNIYHVDANRDSALPGIGSTRINLFRGWLTQDGGARWFAHELGHVWDLNTGLLGYGGEADQLNAKINGNKLLGLFSCRFCDGSGLDHIPAGYAWAPGAYGNNSTADYFAEAFALMVYPSSGPQIPVGVQDWMNGQISAETAWSNFP